jgi:hypothetical protein
MALVTRRDSHDDAFDEPLDPALLQAAREYHSPPQTVPRDRMWEAIARARVSQPVAPIQSRWRAYRVLVAAILLVAAGAAVGWLAHERVSGRYAQVAAHTPAPSAPVPQMPSEAPSGNTAAYRVAVAHDLTGAEALITAFQHTALVPTDGDQAGSDAQLTSWARDLLSSTRLLLDSPAVRDPQRRQLLEDLELVLVQIAHLAPDHYADDQQLIKRTLEHDQVLTRLRSAIPAGTVGL